jgi:hypothetical protein
MTLREFTDRRGVTWRVWDITPDSLRELTGGAVYPAPNYPAEFYRTGWLSFQSLSGTEKRSLWPIPPGWESLSDPELANLLERATRGTPRKSGRPDAGPGSKPSDVARSGAEQVSETGLVRAFVYPGGRAWTVCVVRQEQGGPQVLRFTSAGRSLDLATWPTDWADLPEEALTLLLRNIPRAAGPPGPATPRRRWNDPRA